MDEIDLKLLKLLHANTKQTASQLTKEINLSIPAINKRINKLKDDGVIKNFTIQMDPTKIGKPVIAYLMVSLNNTIPQDDFAAFVASDYDVTECYAITGEYDYILKVYAKSIDDLEDKLLLLREVNGVLRSHTLIALRSYKDGVSPQPE